MELENFTVLTDVSDRLLTWVPNGAQLESDDGSMFDMMDYFDGGSAARNSIIYLAHNDEWSDPLNSDHRAKLLAHINIACRKAGFFLVVKEWVRSTEVAGQWRNIPVNGKLRLYCKRGLTYSGDGENKKNTKTSKPTCVEEICPFKFHIFWFNSVQRWGFIANGGNRTHCGHYHEDERHLKCTVSNLLNEDNMDLALDCLECAQPPSVVDALLNLRADISLTPNQLSYLQQKLRYPNHDDATTPASRFISWLESKDYISYVLLFDKRAETGMMHVRQPGQAERRAEQVAEQVLLHCVQKQSGHAVSHEDITVPASGLIEEDPLEYIKRIRRSMSIPDSNQVLLAAAWCTDQEQRLVSLFPEVMAADVTEQTNKEKRPLIMLGGLTSDNESFTFCRAFLPSMQRWVFDWFFDKAVPILFPKETLMRNTVMFTDGDAKEYGAFLDAKRHFPNSCHHLCSWHMLDRSLKATRIYAKKEDLGIPGINYFNGMLNWVKSWFYTLESMEEFEDSYSRFMRWLETEEVQSILGDFIIDKMIDFITVSLLPYKFKWLFPSFLTTRTLGRLSTQFLEAENSVLKSKAGGPRPYQGIDVAAGRIVDQGARRWRSKDLKFSRATQEISIQNQVMHKNCRVNMYCLEKIIQQYNQQDKYDVIRSAQSIFLVQRISDESIPQIAPDPKNVLFADYIVPKYTRTRKVKVIGGKFLVCSCGLFARCGYPCRHIFAVIQRPPTTSDTIPRYHVCYAHLYNRHEFVTHCYKQELMNEVPGPPLQQVDFEFLALIPIANTIPVKFLESQLSLSSKCYWKQVTADNVNNSAHARFQQEVHLSQANVRDVGDGNEDGDTGRAYGGTLDGSDNDLYDIDDAEDNFAENEKENLNQDDLDEEGIKNCVFNADPVFANAKPVQLYSSLMAYYQDLCKTGETNTLFRERTARRVMYIWELGQKELSEYLGKNKPQPQVGGGVASVTLGVNGPRHAVRRRPIGSPSKKKRRCSKKDGINGV